MLKSLNKNMIFHKAFLFLFSFWCADSYAEPQNAQKAVPYQMQVSNLKSLMLPQSEFENTHNLSGFTWTPFVLPLQNLTITNAALFAGYRENDEESTNSNERKSFLPAP